MNHHPSSVADRRSGTLFIVSTPIGNLEDITLRALRILKEVDLIAAESVRHSKRFRDYYGIDTRMIGYNQHNRKRKGPEILNKLRQGLHIALITSAGTPGISDPGTWLVNQAHEQHIKVTPIPGPSAALAALSASGLRSDRFLFLGFLSSKSGRRRNELKALESEPRTMVFFEAPHRISEFLLDVQEILGDRRVILFREMTKIYEEVIRGPVSRVLNRLRPENIKGEFTVVLAGLEKTKKNDEPGLGTRKRIEKLLQEKKQSVKEIAEKIARDEGLPYRKIYKICIQLKRDTEA